jgi:hypothetical protein
MAQHATFDVTDAAKRITSDVMGHLLYGEDLGGVSWGYVLVTQYDFCQRSHCASMPGPATLDSVTKRQFLTLLL